MFRVHDIGIQELILKISMQKNRHIARTLGVVESCDVSADDFAVIRKAVLDGYNDFMRDTVRDLLGDIEEGSYAKQHNVQSKEVVRRTYEP